MPTKKKTSKKTSSTSRKKKTVKKIPAGRKSTPASQKKRSPKKIDRSAGARRRRSLQRLRNLWSMNNHDGDFNPSSEPPITDMLTSVEGGMNTVLNALRLHDNDDSHDFLELYDQLSDEDRKILTIEEIAHASGVGSAHLVGLVAEAIVLYSRDQSRMLIASATPALLKTSIRNAKTTKGAFDREMVLKAGGILPVPKGTQIAIQNISQPREEAEDTNHAALPAWRSADERLRLITAITEPQKQLEPPKENKIDFMQEDSVIFSARK